MLYAAYGSNLHPLRLKERTPSAQFIGTSAMEGWRLRFHKRGLDGSGKCNVERAEDSVYVAVYDIPDVEMKRLDRIEGVGRGYDTASIQLASFGSCRIYIAAKSHIDDSLAPFSWYKSLVLAGCRHHAFPQPYIDEIERVAACTDGDDFRDSLNMRILSSSLSRR